MVERDASDREESNSLTAITRRLVSASADARTISVLSLFGDSLVETYEEICLVSMD